MPATDDQNERLKGLERRWKAEPGSRVFVQLADEYRRQGRIAEAIEVLEKGLETQPGYVSARVALGRCRLAADDAVGAIEVLEQVVDQDPTHLLANRLLVEAHIEIGQLDQARQRLDLYTLINDGDPEIAVLKARIARAATSAADDTEVVEEEVQPPAPPTSTEAETSPDDLFGELINDEDLSLWAEAFDREGIFPLPSELLPEAAQGAAEREEQEATATLGRLYMAQGHVEEAARIFRAVLARDPQDRASRDALERLERSAGGSETEPPVAQPAPFEEVVRAAPEIEPAVAEEEDESPAAALFEAFGVVPGSEETASGAGGLTERKIVVLRDYLRRMRRAVRHDVS